MAIALISLFTLTYLSNGSKLVNKKNQQMPVIYQEIVNIRRRRILIYCPTHRSKSKNIIQRLLQPFKPDKNSFPWISKIQTEKTVARLYNLELVKSHFFIKLDSSSKT